MTSTQTVHTTHKPAAPEAKTTLVTIIVPVYNEYSHIEEVLQRILAAPMPPSVLTEIIVVNDGSTDGTDDVLKQFHDHPRIYVHHIEKNSGKGSAIRKALSVSKGDIVVMQDGDKEYNPNELQTLVEPILRGQAQVVYGSRFHHRVAGMRLRYRLINILLVGLVRLLYGARLTDEATAYKAFSRETLMSFPLDCRRFEFCPEVTAKVLRSGVPIHEVPISYKPRSIEEGKKIRWKDGVQAIWTLGRYWMWRPENSRKP